MGGTPVKRPMNYYELEVVLTTGAWLPEGWTPGRVFAVPGSVPLRELALAIDTAFGRWDFNHEREFTIGKQHFDCLTSLDSMGLKSGDAFDYEFDLGDSWTHRCLVRNAATDLYKIWDGWRPKVPTPLLGWGALPDQYGRRSETDDGSQDE